MPDEIIPERLPADGIPTHPRFDPDAQAWQCPTCHHSFELYWDPERYRYVTTRPTGIVYPDRSCNDCRKRHADWDRKHGGLLSAAARRRRQRDLAGGISLDGSL